MLHSWNWPRQGGQHGISSCRSEEQPRPPPWGLIVARVSSNPPASPEDSTKELVELTCIEGWVYSLPRDDVLCSEATGQGSQGPQSRGWTQVPSATVLVLARPEQQQLVALALLNLHECDADEYERGNVAVTAGAADGAAPVPPSCPLLGRAHSLSPPAAVRVSPLGTGIRDWDQASKLITLVQKPGFSPGRSRSGRVRE